MFADDIDLVRDAVGRYGPMRTPIVDVGGLPSPCTAQYTRTIEAMEALGMPWRPLFGDDATAHWEKVKAAQMCRYLDMNRPFDFLDPSYEIENPEAGGVEIAGLAAKYDGVKLPRIGTAILLSVLEHVERPWVAAGQLADAMQPGGLAIVSVPWEFPTHFGPKDYWRFSPDGLRVLFEDWNVLDAGRGLDISAGAGVLNIQNGEPQAIRSSWLVARRL